MKRLFSIFLLLPLVCFSAVYCEVVGGGQSESLTINCWTDNQPDDPMTGGPSNVLSQADCEQLKSMVANAISNAVDTLYNVRHNLDSYLEDGGLMQRLNGYISDIYDQLADIDGNQAQVAVIDTKVGLLDDGLHSIYNDMVGNVSAIDMEIDNLRSKTSEVERYVCTSQSCSGNGNGTYSCPCEDVLDKILASVNVIKTHTIEIARLTSSNHVMLVQIAAQMDQIYETMELVKNRLTAPDDRMWGELNDIYSNLYSNLNTIATSQLDVNDLLYSIKQLVRGTGDNNNLQLTTEGVISLYSSLFGMARTVQDQYNYRVFDDSVRYFSNTVSSLFLSYKDLVQPLASRYVPSESRYSFIYQAFTNDSLSARSRYARLSNNNASAVTNWFQRMELYQQAALGWFDVPLKVEHFESNQGSVTESGIENSMEETTNNFNQVSQDVSSFTNGVRNFSTKLTEISQSVTIQPYLPTQIRILPEFEIGDRRFSPIDWDTSPQEDTFKFIRTCTTWLWRISFYVFILVLVYSLCKKVYLFVLYVFHLCQNL